MPFIKSLDLRVARKSKTSPLPDEASYMQMLYK